MNDYTRGDDPIYNGFREGWTCPCDAKEGTEELWEIVDGIPFDRLEALCAAEREGRCVVLPLPGDRLYYAPYPDGHKDLNGEPLFLRNNDDGSGIVKAVRIQVRFDNWMGWVPFRRTFKTLEEAALRQK